MLIGLGLALVLSAAPQDAPRLTRVLVFELDHIEEDRTLSAVLADSIAAEVRKLRGASVLTQNDIAAMLELEAERQVMGCDDDSSCLAEIADALGVDALIVGSLATVGDASVFGLKRIKPQDAKVSASFQERLVRDDGREYLEAVGPAVEKLFPDLPLKAGQTRGVSVELSRRLHPPPLPVWATGGVGTAAAASVVGAGVFAALNATAAANYDSVIKEGESTGVTLARRDEARQALNDTATATWIAIAAATTLGLATALMVPFTNFEEVGE